MAEPNSFEQALKRYDPLLSLRWGPHVQAWVVDREGRVSEMLWKTLLWAEQQPNCEPIDRERVVSARLGKRPVLHTKILANHVFDTLYRDDLQVHGSKIVDRHMKRLEEERLKKRNNDSTSRQAAEALNFLSRRRADPSPEESQRVFEEVMGKSFPTQKKAKKAMKKALLDAHGTPLEGTPEKAIQIAVP